MEPIKQSQAKTGGQLVAVMPDIEKDLNGRKPYKSFYWKRIRNKTKPAKIVKKAGRIRKKDGQKVELSRMCCLSDE